MDQTYPLVLDIDVQARVLFEETKEMLTADGADVRG
jgi:hypothetical protein